MPAREIASLYLPPRKIASLLLATELSILVSLKLASEPK